MLCCLHAPVYVCLFWKTCRTISARSDSSVKFPDTDACTCKCIGHAPIGARDILCTWFFCVRGLPAYIHVCHSTWSRVVRQQRLWHGFESRKHLLVQLGRMYCTQQEHSSLNVPAYNMYTTLRRAVSRARGLTREGVQSGEGTLCWEGGRGMLPREMLQYIVLRLDTLDLRTYWYVVNVSERGGSCGFCFEPFWYRNPKERGGNGKGKDQQYKV